jgi:hypothetical protein
MGRQPNPAAAKAEPVTNSRRESLATIFMAGSPTNTPIQDAGFKEGQPVVRQRTRNRNPGVLLKRVFQKGKWVAVGLSAMPPRSPLRCLFDTGPT